MIDCGEPDSKIKICVSFTVSNEMFLEGAIFRSFFQEYFQTKPFSEFFYMYKQTRNMIKWR